jgi:arginyl-tRNA synthetase
MQIKSTPFWRIVHCAVLSSTKNQAQINIQEGQQQQQHYYLLLTRIIFTKYNNIIIIDIVVTTMVEETKQLSKNELKRLAKKAAREAEKKQKGGAPAAGNDGAPKAKGGGKNVPAPAAEAPTAPKTEIPSLPTSNIYYLANVTNEECPAALKSAVAASAFGITLCRAAVTPSSLPSIFTGPALYANSNTNTVAFGGNGVAKALAALITSTFTAADNVMIDEWLEFERTSLRCTKAKQAAKTLAKLESGLSGGNFLVGKQLSIADIVMVVTLASDKDAIPTYPSAIQSYLNVHLSSPAFINGKEMVKSLVPPPPFDYTNNPSMVRAVNDVFYTAISTLLPQVATTLGKDNDGIFMEKSKILKNGDYQCKEAMPLFSLLKSQNALPNGVLTPMDLAQNIANMIPIDNPICDSFKVNRPGFILCKIKASYLESHLNSFMNSTDTDADNEAKDPKLTLPWNIRESKQTVVVDFSSPNIAKEMHVGHLRSTIIGESVCRILELCGADVKRVNHVGDWGTQFGMLITYLKETHPDFAKKGGNGGDVAISDLTKIYKQAKVSKGVSFFDHSC